jgi:NhaP-type Na+/H+ or K+/H+ antiporter
MLLGKERRGYTRQEKFVMSFVAPRGIDAAAMAPIVAAALVAANYSEAASSIMNMVVVVIILTVVFSTIMAKFAASRRFAGQTSNITKFTEKETWSLGGDKPDRKKPKPEKKK